MKKRSRLLESVARALVGAGTRCLRFLQQLASLADQFGHFEGLTR